LLLVSFTAAAGDVGVGVAAVDITPPLGVAMAGYYHERGADGVLDPLHSKAMVIEHEGERVALVTLDLIRVSRAVTDQARAEIQKATGIKGDHVMVSATHAHTGPTVTERGAGQSKPQQIAAEHTERLPQLIAESVRLATERLQLARLSAAKGRCDGLAFNRRYFMRDGTTGWNPSRLNPNIVMPAGPTDPEVSLLYVELPKASASTEAIATYVNFAMHPDTTGGNKLSADWPGALSRVLSSYHGSNHLTLLANGTCGNINHFDVSWRGLGGGPTEPNRIGTILGAAVFQAYKDLKPVTPGPLRARSEQVELALPEITPEQVEEAKKALDTTKDDRGANFMRLVRSHRTLGIAGRKGEPLKVEVQVISLGAEVAWVSLPGEMFVELGLAIKKRSPFPHTFVVELANDCIGYVPDRRSYAEGNYEPESARCAAGSGEKLVEAAVKLLGELHELKP